jgi:hypothetical protein
MLAGAVCLAVLAGATGCTKERTRTVVIHDQPPPPPPQVVYVQQGPPPPVVYVTQAPPPVVVEQVPPSPGIGFIWVQGYQHWDRDHYVWMKGHYDRPPHAGAVWVQPHYEKADRGGYHYQPGYWKGEH